MKRIVLLILVAGMMTACSGLSSEPGKATADERIILWKGASPGVEEPFKVGEKWGRPITRVERVTHPSLTLFRAVSRKGERVPAVIVCPGGAYKKLVVDMEGSEVCEWLAEHGITGVLLRYRVPKVREEAYKDGRRAVRIVRSRAKEWGIDPGKIGVLGFSAGGHLCARLACGGEKRAYEAVDRMDDVSAVPDFAILIYPAYLHDRGEELPISPDMPPLFIAISIKDPLFKRGFPFFPALVKAKVEAEIHLYGSGPHGFGMRKTGGTADNWPQACKHWLDGVLN